MAESCGNGDQGYSGGGGYYRAGGGRDCERGKPGVKGRVGGERGDP